jgi:hypothetical protein
MSDIKIVCHNEKYTEDNHVKSKPYLLIEHLHELFDKREGGVRHINNIEIKVMNSASNHVVVFKGYDVWLRLDEYLQWMTRLLDVDLSSVKKVELAYVFGLIAPYDIREQHSHYYIGHLKLNY